MKPETIDTHIYFPASLHRKLKALAKRQRHTLSAEIVLAVESHLEAWSHWKRDPAVPRGKGWMDK